jgi:hypothetical protein
MDQIREVIQPVRDFAVESRRLLRRCTKPDRDGAFELACRVLYSYKCCVVIYFIFVLLIHCVSAFRAPKDCHCHRRRIRHDGIHWFLRQAYPHPSQQHHRVRDTLFCIFGLVFLQPSANIPLTLTSHVQVMRRINAYIFFFCCFVWSRETLSTVRLMKTRNPFFMCDLDSILTRLVQTG